jgi:alpha-1,6-mannosyltransferase
MPKWKIIIFGLTISLLLVGLNYFIPRSDFFLLSLCFVSSFVLYFFFFVRYKDGLSLNEGIALGMFFRAILLFSLPNLSDDFYRFIWDGNLAINGINPFEFTPSQVLDSNILPEINFLHPLLNSQDYYSVYPPVLQWVFGLGALIAGTSFLGNVIFFKLILLAAEGFSLVLIIKLLKSLSLDPKKVFLYAWNPLVVLEIIGNIHFEGLYLPFLLLFLVGLVSLNEKKSVAGLIGGVGSKLIPLYLVPLTVFRLGVKTAVRVGAVSMIGGLIIFLPYFYKWEFIQRFLTSVDLYFKTFEFNGGVYLVLRNLISNIIGYNPIQTLGPILGGITWGTALFLGFYFRKKPVFAAFWILFFILFFASIVHPWYIIPFFCLSLFTPYRFALWWTLMIFGSYFAYSNAIFSENYLLVGLEYFVVFGALIFELTRKNGMKKPQGIPEV